MNQPKAPMPIPNYRIPPRKTKAFELGFFDMPPIHYLKHIPEGDTEFLKTSKVRITTNTRLLT